MNEANKKEANSCLSQEIKFPDIREKIGTTTYEVYIHFSKTSTETISDKIKRLIQQDCTKFT